MNATRFVSTGLRFRPFGSTGYALRVVERHARIAKNWWVVYLGRLLEPFIFLFSVGVGVGALVENVTGPGGAPIPYRTFVAPAMLVDGNEPVIAEPTEITVESDGYTLVMGQDRSTATVTVTDASGELVADETHDWQSNEEPTTWRSGRSGIDIIDPESGEVIVRFGNDVLEQAYNEQTDRDDQFREFDPDLWLVATVTGDRWLVEDLDTTIDFDRAGPESLAINGTTLILSIGDDDGWQRYDLI